MKDAAENVRSELDCERDHRRSHLLCLLRCLADGDTQCTEALLELDILGLLFQHWSQLSEITGSSWRQTLRLVTSMVASSPEKAHRLMNLSRGKKWNIYLCFLQDLHPCQVPNQE